jgi:hypothetical protein
MSSLIHIKAHKNFFLGLGNITLLAREISASPETGEVRLGVGKAQGDGSDALR